MTLSAQIDANGISAPNIEEITAFYQAKMRGIYGSDIYIEPDSQDGQMIAVLATAQGDVNNMAKAVYLSFSPATAQGIGLSNNVKLNGIRRQIPSNSTVDLLCVGRQGVDLSGLIVGDNLNLGTRWILPGVPGSGTVVIPGAGQITVTATSITQGDVRASANTLTKMITPTRDWQTVNNPADATPGSPVETDAQLRQRQSTSTAYPALSVLGGVWGSIGNVAGVTRFTIAENDKDPVDANGVPGHTIAAIVQGGTDQDIASALALKKGPGVGTYGTTSVTVVNPFGVGIPETIKFFRLTSMQVSMLIYLTPLLGFVTATEAMIQTAVAYFLSTLSIGETSFLSRLWAPADLQGVAATASSGKTQASLDAFSNTYNLTALYQARSDMVTTAAYPAGTVTMNIQNAKDYGNTKPIAFTLDNGTIWKAVVSAVAGSNVTFAPAVPAGRTVPLGTQVYLAGDVTAAFTEAFAGTPANLDVITP